MDKRVHLNLFYFFFLLLSSFTVSLAQTSSTSAATVTLKTPDLLTKSSPFSPKSSLIRYWKTQISNDLPIPSFLLSKASPLPPFEYSLFTKLASNHSLSSHLSSFCSSADLVCFSDSSSPESSHPKDSNFAVYDPKSFSNYGASHIGGGDTFKNYSENTNFATSAFARYTGAATGHREGFASYGTDANVANSNFTSYASDATGGNGDFASYMPRVNVPDLRFAAYSANGNHHPMSFKSYVDDTNSGNQLFLNYAKNGNGVPVGFTGYGDTSNVVGSTFSHYSELGNGANDTFKAYSTNANNPKNDFRGYGGSGGNAGSDTFVSYRDRANSGTDTFVSYGRKSNSGKTNFVNYGKSFNPGSDSFREYGKGSTVQTTGFSIYAMNSTFKEYTKTGVTFGQYTKPGSKEGSTKVDGSSVNKWAEPVKFFREKMLKKGSIVTMPDIVDKMPKRSFLPRAITSKLPFATDKLSDVKEIFQAQDKTVLDRVLTNTLSECERAPSRGETKRCVGSIEDMVDFTVSVLGHDVVVRTTENVRGSKKEVMIGEVKGINGGKITKSVSCHQSLYPYLLYYCHSVPKVRVYVAEILDVSSKEKINNGVAICHIDTSAWSPGHGAFMALGSGPGRIEVCHWIFENDMTWTTSD
ncbi:polygalacturonase 1 beta-like protein 3 [Cynara cardunculus var. scolymus]|uniref:BURP domain-containing protein n=1 Tax=Cynara cardunculus var. scolymus TaxID=59895 RepID=A0A103XXW2_CYNCS|nr:polygalacturonase 1 beta-like protein 3 [Cynara cardunculus var. scolymus]KVH98958.1 BURP domain-containing protein [Cynara cardunculus var. scolymus]